MKKGPVTKKAKKASKAKRKPMKIKHMDPSEMDPNAPGGDEGIFGLPFNEANASLVLLPVPFEATTSYGSGTEKGPKSILKESVQVDLYHEEFPDAWKKGVFLLNENRNVKKWNTEGKALAKKVRNARSESQAEKSLKQANELGAKLNDFVEWETSRLIKNKKIVGLVGGDHAVPYGSIKAHLEKYPDMGILHFDAHFDLRKAYEGFEWSHASIMYNVISRLHPRSLVQVGIRDFCDEEWAFAQEHGQIRHFLDSYMFSEKAKGVAFDEITNRILEPLPEKVYVSFDIDGLDPAFCPQTGTPVPGGLSYNEAVYILRKLVQTGREIIGFDLNEVGPGKWDGNVGARMLYELSVLSLSS